MRSDIENLLFVLLRLGLDNSQPDQEDLLELRDIDSVNWERLINLSTKQGVLGIAFDGIVRLRHHLGIDLSSDWYFNTIGGIAYRERRNEIQIESMLDLCKIWNKEGVNMMLLKGQANSLYYPNPKHRDCGDIDCYLLGNYKKGNSVIRKLGISVNEDWEKHAKFDYKGETIENHQFFVQTLDSKWWKALHMELLSLVSSNHMKYPQTNILLAPVQFNALFLTYHAMEHFTMGNLRLKQIADWAMFVKVNNEIIDWPKLYEQCEKFGMDKFLSLMNGFISEKLNVRAAGDESSKINKSLLDKVTNSVLRDEDFAWLRDGHHNRWEGRIHYIKYVVKYRWKINIAGRSAIRQLWLYVISYRKRNKNYMEEKKYYCHESSYVDEGVRIGEGTKIWHFCHIQKGADIGKNCSLGQNVNIGNNVHIGNGVRIQNNVSVYEGVEIEDNVFCGPSCVFTNVTTPRAHFPVHGIYAKTLIKEGASLGANCTIVCGHTVGRSALIGSGAVVAKDVKNYALMVGVPAKQIGWVCECGKKLDDTLKCECGRKYILNDDELVKE